MNNWLDRVIEMCIAELGLENQVMSSNEWQKIISNHMEQIGLANYEVYYQSLKDSASCFQELLERVVIPETWFMREQEGLAYIPYYFSRLIKDANSAIPFFSVLSLPCSSGEEPYSISMLLHDAGFSGIQYKIDAVDVSSTGIRTANHGVYGSNSFRNSVETFKHAHFDSEGEKLRVKNIFRKNVTFSCENVLRSKQWKAKGLYDVIVCRNFFLYLNSIAQKELAEDFKQILKPQGILIVGSSELQIFKSLGFETFGNLKNCAMKLKVTLPHVNNSIHQPVNKIVSVTKKIQNQQRKWEKVFSQAKLAANQGCLQQALAYCREYLLYNAQDPEVYYLMGLIHHADEKLQEAKDFFRKALYLDPNHYDTLMYMALLEEMIGENTQATALRKRAEKARAKKEMEGVK